MEQFTIEQGLEFQSKDLQFWKTVLKDDFYQKLVSVVEKEQNTRIIKNGYGVVRGSEISCMVHNILL
jgi:hypothetical protein